MATYTGTIYVEETDECFRLFICPGHETVYTEVEKATQVEDFRFVDTFLQKDNIMKVEKVDWDKTDSGPEATPDQELQNVDGDLMALEEFVDDKTNDDDLEPTEEEGTTEERESDN